MSHVCGICRSEHLSANALRVHRHKVHRNKKYTSSPVQEGQPTPAVARLPAVTADSSDIEVTQPRTSLEHGYDVRIDPEVLACYLYTRRMALERGYGRYDFNEWLKDAIVEHYEEDLHVDVEVLTRRLNLFGDLLV